MTQIEDLHNQAMALADEAAIRRLRGELAAARGVLHEALQLERSAALLAAPEFDLEPTRSVLHRSAASLALECGEYREAERLIGSALFGEPPEEIANELRDLLEQVHLQRHLDLKGIVLEPTEFQMSLTGRAIGYGVADSEVFVTRLQGLEKAIFRTAERKAGRPFREAGRRQGKLQRELEMFLSVPRAASFAVSIRLGYSQQLSLPGTLLAEEVIGELMECLELYERMERRELRSRIPDKAYYRNFVSLVHMLAPDGDDVRAVGFTAMSAGGERRVVLGKERPEWAEEVAAKAFVAESVVVRGTLKAADARSEAEGKIILVDDKRKSHTVIVPAGMMDDIVRPLWDYEVIVTGVKEHRIIRLDRIDRAKP